MNPAALMAESIGRGYAIAQMSMIREQRRMMEVGLKPWEISDALRWDRGCVAGHRSALQAALTWAPEAKKEVGAAMRASVKYMTKGKETT